MFRRETRPITKKGTFTIPVQIRRALGIYNKTQVDILPGEGEDTLLLIKSKPHCICCGKVGSTLVPVNSSNSRFVCSDCINQLKESLDDGVFIVNDVTTLDVIDNYNHNLECIDKLKEENIKLENEIQEEGISKMRNNKTVLLNGRNSSIKVQVSYTVRNVTDAAYLTLIDYMNQFHKDIHLHPETVKKYEMSAQFKNAATIIYTSDYLIDTFDNYLSGYQVTKADVEELESKWKIDSDDYNKKLLDDLEIYSGSLLDSLNQIAKFNYVKQIFPKIKSESDLDLMRSCLLVSSCIKIKK